MKINTNVAALNTYGKLNAASVAGSKSMERLSSGLRINRAADDAAGLAISEKMRAQIRGLDQAQRNSQDGVSMIQTAEGAMNTQHSILQRMRELSVQASNSTLTDADKQNIQEEMNQLIDEVDRIAGTTEFNNIKLLNGEVSEVAKNATVLNTAGQSVASVKAGANATVGNTVVSLGNVIGTDTAAIYSTAAFSDASTGLAITKDTTLTNLTDGTNTLGIAVGDEITISATVGGEIKTATFVVKEDSSIEDFMSTIQNTIGGTDSEILSAPVALPLATVDAEGLDGDGTGNDGSLQFTGKTGYQNDITEFSISAKSSDGFERAGFNNYVNQGANGGLYQNQVAANKDDQIATINIGDQTDSKGDSTVAVRALATVKASNIEVTFSDTLDVDDTATVTIGSQDKSARIQIGANEGQNLNISIEATTAEALGLRKDGVTISVMTAQSASESITKINDAINTVSAQRAKLGALQNRLEYTNDSLSSTAENMTVAESRIRDVDMAKEMMQFTKNNILSQAAQSMLAQANQQPQQVLQLLR
ncbi:flagellin [Neobacillus vireti]|uniref:flagellin N-terminal helical domain-containing protein n=1 Tax=Neobacillus vireti TaxID=220686 RepID=UPI002FFE418C